MKFLFCLILLSFIPFTQQQPSSLLVGRWMGVDKNEVGYVQFDSNGYAAFEINGELVGGKEFILEGEKNSMTYAVIDSLSPIAIDLQLKNLTTNEEKTMRMIAQFYGKDSLQLGSNFSEVRPTEFTEDNAIMLTRSL